MPQVSLRLHQDLLDQVDALPGDGERAAKIRWLLEQGLRSLEEDRQLGELRQLIEQVGREAAGGRRAAEQVAGVLPKNGDGQPVRLAADRPPAEYRLEGGGWFGKINGKLVPVTKRRG
jgi:hypothetical protein